MFAKSYENRRAFIGGSDARIIMGSDEAALVRLWREKRGEAEPEDLSGNLIVQLGTATEELNRTWYDAIPAGGSPRCNAASGIRQVDGGDLGRHRGGNGSCLRGQTAAALEVTE